MIPFWVLDLVVVVTLAVGTVAIYLQQRAIVEMRAIIELQRRECERRHDGVRV